MTSGHSGVISRLRRSRLEFGGMSGSRWSEVSMDTQTIGTKTLDISMLEDSVVQHRKKTVVKEGWSVGSITSNREGGESVRSSQGLLFKGEKGMLLYK